MAGSGGSLDDYEIDFDHESRRNGFSSASFDSSQGSDDIYSRDVFSAEPQGQDILSMTQSIEEDIRPQPEFQEADEDGDIGPLTPRGKIIGNGFERPIHRQSLQEFENLEQIFREQSQDSAEGVGMDERFLLGNGDVAANGGVNRGYKIDRRSSGDMDFRSHDEYDMGGSGRHNGISDGERSFGDAAEAEGNMHNGGEDIMKYMQATPRSAQEFPSSGDHNLSRLMENSYDNDSLDDYRGEVNGHHDPQISSQPDFFSLSQEQLPEGPSHLESEDGSDIFASSGNNTLKGRESLTTVIQAAAANVETFGTGDSPEGKKDSSGGDVEHFKPIATSHRRPSRPQTAAQLKNKTISEHSSAGEQHSQQSIDSRRRTNSVKSFRTRSSRASTPQSVLSESRRSSRASIRSHDDQSEYSIQESVGQLTPRSSTPGHDLTLVRRENEFSPSPVKRDGKSPGKSPEKTIPRLRLDNMSGRSEQSSVSDIQLLDKSARSRLVSDEFVDQLQKEYDELLQKYAQAENTIDSLRLGARVNLHYEGAPGGQPGNAGMSPAKHGQNITLAQGQKGVVSSSRSGSLPHTPGGNSTIHIHTGSNVSMGASTSSKGESRMPTPDASEGKLLALQFQTEGHKEKMDSFEILLKENHLNPADQQTALEGLKLSQAKLEADYMQAKEEHTMKARLGSARGQQVTFDPERSVEGQLFQLGMRLEDLQEIVQGNLRSNPPELPATPQRKASDADMATKMDDAHGVGPVRGQSNTQCPEEDYALLLSRYDALKQLPPNPERDREIQQLVKSLQDMPDFALESVGQPDHGDEAGYHGNNAEMMIEDEIDFIGDGEDHDGDVDGSSSHSSPFRETTSPDVFRPKGTRQDELPKWQPPEDGSISSLGSPDHDPPSSSIHSRRKSVPGKTSSKQTPPRPTSGHRSSHARGDAGGDTRKQRGTKNTPGTHLEPEGDSGFLGSESSRQSLQTRGSDTRTRNRAQRLPPHSEIPKIAPTRDSRIPLQLQKGNLKTPLRSSEPVPLRQQAVPEEEDSIYSGGGKRARERKPEGTLYEPQESVYSSGSKRTRERRPQPTQSLEQQRRDPRAVINQPRAAPSPPKQREQRAYAPPPQAQPSRHSSHEPSIPLGSQYLSRSATHQNSRASAPQRMNNQRTEPPRRPRELPPRQHQPEFDGRSDVTRSSVRSDALRALQDEVSQLKNKMAEARRNPPPIPEESRYSKMRNRGDVDEDGLSTWSSKSEMLHMLQEEIEDLKDQIADRDAAPSRIQAPPVSSTPMRDTIRDVLRDRYIPKGNGSSFSASPIKTSPKKHNSGVRHDSWSTMRRPSYPSTDNQSYSWSRGPKYTPASPPEVSRRPGGFQTPGVGYQTGTVPCPMCGGSGSHTHGEYSYPPPLSNPASPPEPYVPAYSSPAPPRVYPQTPSYTPTHPSPAFAPQTVPATPQNNPAVPLIQGQSYVLQQPYPAVTPQHVTVVPQASQQLPGGGVPQVIGTVPSAAPAMPVVNQTSAHQPSGTPNHLHPDARPVYLIPGKSRGRYYIREGDDGSSVAEGEEELYYRRTPRSSRTRSRHTPRTITQQKVSEVPAELQLSLDDALHMAQRLKRTTHQMVSSVRRDVRLAESFNG